MNNTEIISILSEFLKNCGSTNESMNKATCVAIMQTLKIANKEVKKACDILNAKTESDEQMPSDPEFFKQTFNEPESTKEKYNGRCNSFKPHENPVNKLQELTQKQKVKMPEYTFEKSDGNWKCLVEALDLSAYAFANSKQEAKKNAAEKLLAVYAY